MQLLNDFVKSEIGRRTNILATVRPLYRDNGLRIQSGSFRADDVYQSGFSASPAATYQENPQGIISLSLIFRSLVHCSTTLRPQEVLSPEPSLKAYFYNPYDVNPHYIDKYHESAHLATPRNPVYASVQCNYTKCNITKTLEKIDNSIYILGGEAGQDIDLIIKEYTKCNPAIESSTIPNTKHLPQIENPEEVSSTVQMFFN